jgi:hypothetical protein
MCSCVSLHNSSSCVTIGTKTKKKKKCSITSACTSIRECFFICRVMGTAYPFTRCVWLVIKWERWKRSRTDGWTKRFILFGDILVFQRVDILISPLSTTTAMDMSRSWHDLSYSFPYTTYPAIYIIPRSLIHIFLVYACNFAQFQSASSYNYHAISAIIHM